MLHYLITNRQILTDKNGKEFIEEDGLDTAGEENEMLRFAVFDSDTFRKTKSCKPAITLLSEADVNENVFVIPPNQEGDVMCFIHGFHTDLNGIMHDMCALENKYIHDDSPIKYLVGLTWPARKSFMHYKDDARDAEFSGYTFARNFHLISDFFNLFNGPAEVAAARRNIHLLAHSMGNRMLENMMLHLSSRTDVQLSNLFKEVILAAADADWTVFEDPRAFARLTNICHRITVYHHEEDIALMLSEAAENKNKRLGKFGLKEIEKIAGNVYSVDCSDINDEHGFESKLIQHWYHQDSDITVYDIIQVFKGKHVDDFLSESLRVAKADDPRRFRLNIHR